MVYRGFVSSSPVRISISGAISKGPKTSSLRYSTTHTYTPVHSTLNPRGTTDYERRGVVLPQHDITLRGGDVSIRNLNVLEQFAVYLHTPQKPEIRRDSIGRGVSEVHKAPISATAK